MPQDVKDLPSYAKSTLRPLLHKLYPTSAQVFEKLSDLIRVGSDHKIVHDYIINVVYDRYALKGRAYAIMFYLDKPTQPFCNSKADPNFIGQVYSFSKPYVSKGKVTCANCQKQSEVNKLSQAQIPLTLPLLRIASTATAENEFGLPFSPSLGQIPTEKVETIFEQKLKWYFIEAGGILRHPNDFPNNTQVTVLQGEGRQAKTDAGKVLPTFGRYQILKNATKRQPFGYGNKKGRNDLTLSDPEFR